MFVDGGDFRSDLLYILFGGKFIIQFCPKGVGGDGDRVTWLEGKAKL